MKSEPVAIFYQAGNPPAVGKIKKPMKPGGYSDSGADIGFALKSKNVNVVAPAKLPQESNTMDWVFPDTPEGFQHAYDLGARCFWLNTVLYKNHPAEKWFDRDVRFVGQLPSQCDLYDDKFETNLLLQKKGLCVAKSITITSEFNDKHFPFPAVIKPIRGRGSQGVFVVKSFLDLKTTIKDLITSELYGDEFMLEEYLPGDEITVTVIPPGTYSIYPQTLDRKSYWNLPPVLRFNHIDGVAPYNGVVAVTNNSRALKTDEYTPAIKAVLLETAKAGMEIGARALIRIDCRQAADGTFKLFDLNMKPNITGAGRMGRDDQDSLTTMAARQIGWSYPDLLWNMYQQSWRN